MSSASRFSDVSEAYNSHVANLDRARRIFEEEIATLNDFVFKHLEDRVTWPSEGIRKVRWGDPEPSSSARESAWLNWVAATRLRMDIKPPMYRRFRKAAAYVYFQTTFEQDLGRFMFACRLENQNTVDADLDEQAITTVQQRAADFPNSLHVKRNRALLYRCELQESLFDEVNDWIDRGLGAIAETVDRLFPDSQYQQKRSPEDADEDEDDSPDDSDEGANDD